MKSILIKDTTREEREEIIRKALYGSCGADIIVATGFDEGGTLPDMTLGTFSIVPLIVDAVEHVPVMAAGGIYSARSFNSLWHSEQKAHIRVTSNPAEDNLPVVCM